MSGQQQEIEGAVFDRVFSAAARARQELSRNEDSLFSSTRQLFRRRPALIRGSSGGRMQHVIWKTSLFLLPGPDNEVLPATTELVQMAKHGLGKPAHESPCTRVKSKIDLNWSLSDLNNFICQSYPKFNLNLVGFQLARTGKGRKIQILKVASVQELKKSVGKSRLYIIPQGPILQITQTTPSDEPVSVDEPVSADEPVSVDEPISIDEPISVDETVSPPREVRDQALQEWRRLREEQDRDYNQSLIADQESRRRRLAFEEDEKNRLKAIEARRQRMALLLEPTGGVPLKFKYPDGHIKQRRFNMSEPIHVLFDFVGQIQSASEVFTVQEATAQFSIKSTCTGIIWDHIRGPTTLYVLWLSFHEVKEILGQENHESPTQSLSQPEEIQESPAHSPAQLTTEGPLDIFPVEPSPPVIIIDEGPGQSEPLDIEENNLGNILLKLNSHVDADSSQVSNQINICRDSVFDCSLRAFNRKNFNPEAKLDVVFIDNGENAEGAVDEGGPTREYIRLLMKDIHKCPIFEGHEKKRQLRLDTHAFQTKLYTAVAKMLTVCAVHGGVGPHFFSERLYNQVCGLQSPPTKIEEIGDHAFREQLIKIHEAMTVTEANSAILEAADSLGMIGALRHVSSLDEKESLVQSAADFFVNGRLQAALNQFIEGFKTLGLLKEMKRHPALFLPLFVNEDIPLQAKDLVTLFKVDFSVQGSNRRAKENRTICFWRDLLIEIEEGECSITLENILEFASGASSVPVVGKHMPHNPSSTDSWGL
ncbi:uncharacterized protein LOC121642078 isoform X2 [Melanotaenia boesemani]|uniref:uncharacterized protein LOC121642078 isoform X2 n=1 Tax=Melanotaenia boesemani TaxID=1250792 RepID=UPI001C05E6E0|nr:uncharacterized protein LOC121642078 isoform X2 [Melanotaenia boesemani]